MSLRQIQSQLKYHLITEIKIKQNQGENQTNSYQLTGKIKQNRDAIKSLTNRAGRFILATNRLYNKSLIKQFCG